MKTATKLVIFIILFLSMSTVFNAQGQKDRIDVLYFHATMRCHGCLTIEEFSKRSVISLFEKQVKDSSIVFFSHDFMLDENAHFMEDYKFDSQALVLSKKVNGKEVKWKNLDKIWDYVGDYQKFENYIKTEINNFLKES